MWARQHGDGMREALRAADADAVAVIEGGGISEYGSHDELIAREGAYATLWGARHG